MPPNPDVLIPEPMRAQLRANAAAPGPDHVPVLKLFNPVGPGVWLVTELDPDGDTMFGLCDLDMGCPELGSVSLREITAAKLPFGLAIERDGGFRGRVPISRWAEIARRTGSVRAAEAVVRAQEGRRLDAAMDGLPGDRLHPAALRARCTGARCPPAPQACGERRRF